jgi:RimJ/RimL family protein N-acetyltransferase
MRTLTTDRLVLKPWEQDFEGDLLRFASDPRVMRFIGDGRPWEREFTVQRHQALLEHWEQHGFGWRGIVGDDGAFLGVAALSYLGDLVPGIEESAIEIGWWVDPAAWGKGLATEAALALRDEAFGNLEARRIVARFVPANHASERVMIKLGMRLYGDTTGRKGEAVRVYDLDRAAWLANTSQ